MTNTSNWLQRRADDVGVIMLSLMFLAFVVQITARYVFNYPLGWTLELCLTMWLWTVFWGASFSLRNEDHVRFDMIYLNVSPKAKRWLAAIAAIAIVVTMLVALPRTYDFISFLKIKKSGTLRIPLMYVFSVYLVFMVATIAIYARGLVRIFKGEAS
ncbi:TRAP transporter small permease subunit [Betaproteobacteria bacterium LSUCC0117]|jgi:C4-dicarboxylate transporter, DctQ subunit|nr:TRAP transporter small permease subunit [Betaproteobacteria bacterium LSUCC0117]MDP4861979.1 TRAP transporter small permease [Burkholderiaceae bacterium]